MVRGESVELSSAAGLNLGDAPSRRARGAESHEKGGAGPQVIHVGTAELRGGKEGVGHVRPVSAEEAEVGVRGHGVRQAGSGNLVTGRTSGQSGMIRGKCRAGRRRFRRSDEGVQVGRTGKPG